MAFFGSSWDELTEEYNKKEVGISMSEAKLKMIALLMDVLKCRKDHAETLVNNHMKKNVNNKLKRRK